MGRNITKLQSGPALLLKKKKGVVFLLFHMIDLTTQTVGVEDVPGFVYLKQMPFQIPVGYLSCLS